MIDYNVMDTDACQRLTQYGILNTNATCAMEFVMRAQIFQLVRVVDFLYIISIIILTVSEM